MEQPPTFIYIDESHISPLFSGSGLGKAEHGITQAIKVNIKHDSHGVSEVSFPVLVQSNFHIKDPLNNRPLSIMDFFPNPGFSAINVFSLKECLKNDVFGSSLVSLCGSSELC